MTFFLKAGDIRQFIRQERVEYSNPYKPCLHELAWSATLVAALIRDWPPDFP